MLTVVSYRVLLARLYGSPFAAEQGEPQAQRLRPARYS